MGINQHKLFARLFFKPFFYVLFFTLIVFSSGQAFSNTPKLLPAPEFNQQCIKIVKTLERNHYLEKQLDNALSSIILDHYIQQLDSAKRLFTVHDISGMKQYKYRLDDELKQGNLDPAFQIYNLYLSRSIERFEFILSLTKNWQEAFDFTKDDSIIIDKDLRQWQPALSGLYASWRKDLKNHIILMHLDGEKKESIGERLEKIYTNRLKNLKKTNSTDVFAFFMNTVTQSFDPHTGYMPPRISEDFDMQMSLSLEGIGALLQTESDYTKVVRLIPKGPADKSNLLMPGDKIIGVGQGEEGEMKDVIGQRLDYVVRLIRGPKNTFVTLKIIPAKETSSTKTIRIKRDTVKLEDRSAKKHVITLTRNHTDYKIGVIEIPSFYRDFNAFRNKEQDFKSVTRDVQKIIVELEEEQIDGLIIDLRDNGGGSLTEAEKLTGLFIKTGPIVQVKSKALFLGGHSRPEPRYDKNPYIAYSGPMVVLINRMSASASEIFAGAIKDYKRGIIVGTRTYGKGTVQQIFPIGQGDLKLTISKFYRVSGESTQNLGVLPDISFPHLYDIDQIGESSLDNALPWDTINRVFYWAYPSLEPAHNKLAQNFENRSNTDPGVIFLKKRTQLVSKLKSETSISLNLKKREERKAKYSQMELDIENEYLKATGQETIEKLNQDDAQAVDVKKIILNQAHHVMADFIQFSKANNLSW